MIKLGGDFLADLIENPAFLTKTFLPLVSLCILDCQYCLPGQGQKKMLVLLTESLFPRAFKIEHTNHFLTIEQRHIQFCNRIISRLDINSSPLSITMDISHPCWFLLLHCP